MKKVKTESNTAINKILQKAKQAPMPQDVEPMLATLVNEPVAEEGWHYEMKWDGYRALAYLENGKVELRSRNNKSFNQKFYPVREILETWNMNVLLDGEILVVNEQGVPDFSDLQLWRSEADGQLLFYVFDILWYDGYDVMNLPIEERRNLLKNILPQEH
jgi:bifunctional non-homologous end joining protein LigD